MKKTHLNNFRKFLACFCAFLTAGISFPALATMGRPEEWAMGFQPAASPMREKMESFHDGMLVPITFAIAIFVLLLLLWVMVRYNSKANPRPSKTTHNTMLEVLWTLIPVVILAVITIPSMKMLYYIDRTNEAEMTLKITGYQWYWGYEYPDDGGINFMSNMVPDKDLKPGQARLLATDNPIVLPVDTNIRLLLTASDVIHSWSVPAFGVKLDAVPGRLNETWVRIDKTGTFYGQCSQLCGQNHAFMPIEVKAVSKEDFAKWVVAQGGAMPGTGKTTAGPGAANVTKMKGAAAGGLGSKDKAPTQKAAEKAAKKKQKTTGDK